MGKITDALKKAAEERMERIEKINRIKTRSRMIIARKKEDSNVDPRIITYFDPKAQVTEQYKRLRTNILSINSTKPPRVIALSSSIHSEGKSITSLNLAVTLAHSTHKPKVILIDADMRKGRMDRYLGVEQPTGLSEVLSGQAEAEDVMFQIDIENLTFMSAGQVPDNPAELLASNVMSKLLTRLRSEYDYVLIDTPPIISVTDAGIIGAQTDGVIVVIQAGRTQRGIVDRATEMFHQTHTKVLGFVLTSIEYHLPEYIYRYL